jgi:hypothetical protein
MLTVPATVIDALGRRWAHWPPGSVLLIMMGRAAVLR